MICWIFIIVSSLFILFRTETEGLAGYLIPAVYLAARESSESFIYST